MTKKHILIFIICSAIVSSAFAQGLQIIPNPPQNDFCSGGSVTLTITPYNPQNTYAWYYEFNANYSNTTGVSFQFYDYGQSINVAPGSLSVCTFFYVEELDMMGNLISQSPAFYLGSNSGPIPSQFNYCDRLSVPVSYTQNSTLYSGFRSAMWYKNGAATGVFGTDFINPTNGVYEYRLTLACGSTITTGLITLNNVPPIPVITVNGSTTICPGDSVTMSIATNFNNPRWYRNGSLVGTGYTYKATLSGTYFARGTVGTCLRYSDPVVVTVLSGAFITASDSARCVGDSILLSCTAASSYQWKKDGVNITGATSQTYYAKQSGSYTVVTTGLTCNTSVPKQLTFYAIPTVTVTPSGSQAICKGTGLTLNAIGTNISQYQWTKGNVNQSGATASTLLVTKAGNYRCVVSNILGCSKTSSVVAVTVNNIDSLPVKWLTQQPDGITGKDSWVGGPTGQANNYGSSPYMEVSNFYKNANTYERGLIAFDVSSIPAGAAISSATLKLYIDSTAAWTNNVQELYIKRIIQSWNENTVNFINRPGTTNYQSVTVPKSAIANQTYINIDIKDFVTHWLKFPSENHGVMILSNEAQSTFKGWLRIASSDNSNAALRPKLTIAYTFAKNTNSGSLTFCDGNSVKLKTTAGYSNYQWYKNNVPVAGATTDSLIVTQSGDYYAVISNTAGCSVASEVKTATTLPLPPATITPQGPTTFCAGGSVQLNANSGTGYAYQWKKNGVNITGAVNLSYTATTAGTYKVQVTDGAGCKKLSIGVTVSVPCRDGEWNNTDEGNNLFVVYPNPAASEITVMIENSILNDSGIFLTIQNTLGQQVLQKKITETSTTLDIAGLADGIYFISLNGGKFSERIKLIVQQ